VDDVTTMLRNKRNCALQVLILHEKFHVFWFCVENGLWVLNVVAFRNENAILDAHIAVAILNSEVPALPRFLIAEKHYMETSL